MTSAMPEYAGGALNQKSFGSLGLLATVKMLWDDPLVAKPVEQPEGLGADILVIEVRKHIAKEKDARPFGNGPFLLA
jgi:hypothetical protein